MTEKEGTLVLRHAQKPLRTTQLYSYHILATHSDLYKVRCMSYHCIVVFAYTLFGPRQTNRWAGMANGTKIHGVRPMPVTNLVDEV